ncbi:oxysterol-binding protein-related protein 2A-like isoform X2 [Dioscorea cayenensis subsp. rotundata]|uniref:Oxysterol-binding protein-related protein 2A-like isoform X2 n=1 Tax=Dioscorea cayennensis subsp. rotundata TaxID=55577 RepID=A0AB40B629_DIOCR|nr:oxysterol-binding protein-related protein 2A-like isoform X2 [Dioscorea cayenensis subsp. rotundata]
MKAKAMHPLCCISLDCPGIGAGDLSPPPPDLDAVTLASLVHGSSSEDDAAVAGVLYKWTNYGRGWRPRWFSLRNGVFSYSKIRRREDDGDEITGGINGARLIGNAARVARAGGRPVGIVYLKISSFRESKSDDRRFYIFSPTKTLHLKTESKKDRVAWIEALVSARRVISLNDKLTFSHNDIAFSTEKLRDRMRAEGLGEELIKDCEQIMISELSEYHRQLKVQYEEHITLLKSTYDSQLEEGVTVDDESRAIHESQLQLMKHEFSSSGHGKFSEYSTTESSDDVGKRDLDELSDEDEPYFFDTEELFNDCNGTSSSMILGSEDNNSKGWACENHDHSADAANMHTGTVQSDHVTYPHIQRRKRLPEPTEKEKYVSLWSVIKDNVGKDLTRVCLPVYFNEPLSSLQKCCEEMEYSYLLDRAYEYGKMGNSLMRILNVAAFAVSGYASCDGRLCKPFNPLLGETYEADYPEKGIRFFSEKVSHHPMLIACHCEGKGWKFWGDSNLRSKFWGRSIQLDPVGTLTLEFDDGEVFQWNKFPDPSQVTTTIYNLILGKVYCDHHGTMNIRGNSQYSCKLKFKEQSLLDRNPRQVQGFVEDCEGAKVAALRGKWDDSMYYTEGDAMFRTNDSRSPENTSLLWRRSKPPDNPTRYNLSSFAITLNELTPELQEKLPPTDSRLRPDQRHLENGEYEKANAEKQRLERRQRMSRKLQQDGWKPRWFQMDSETGTYRYVGGYWEAREKMNWDGCPHIFSETLVDNNVTSCS